MSILAGAALNRDNVFTTSIAAKMISRMIEGAAYHNYDKRGIWSDSRVALGLVPVENVGEIFSGQHLNSKDAILAVINGKIYNCSQLKEQLKSLGCIFRGESENEVIAHGYKQWGVNIFAKLTGMFSIAIWDSVSKKLILARDRFGEKPIYYFNGPDAFVFASEIKAILAFPKVPRIPDKAAIHNYLTFGYTVGPYTAFSGIMRIQPAHFMVMEVGKEPVVERYWSLPDISIQKLWANTDDLKVELMERLQSAVESCLTLDVTTGVFLTGGINSSAVVAMMAVKKGSHIKTFSSSFGLEGYDDYQFVEMVSDRYQTEHRNNMFGDELLANIPKLAWHYGEPFSNIAALLTFSSAKKAREYISVALTCEGADEILLGRQRYSHYKFLLEEGSRGRELGELYLGQGRVSARKIKAADTYGYIIERFREFQKVSSYGLDMFTRLQKCSYDQFIPFVEDAATAEEMAARLDVAICLPDDLLVMNNVAMMAAGLEGKRPFLNHEFAEFALSIPAPQRLLNGYENGLLKSALEPYLPHELIYHSKISAQIPDARYMRDVAYRQTKELLLSDRFISRGVITEQAIETMLSEHRSNKQDHSSRLWTLVGLEIWYRTWIDSDTGKELIDNDNPFAEFATESPLSKTVGAYN